jgi:hypothetical protein
MITAPWKLVSGLLDARAHLNAAEKALQNGAMKSARYETLSAEAATDRARAGYDSSGPVMDLLRTLPRVGDALDETEHLVRAAELSAEAARGTLSIAEGALRGPDKIIERDPADPTRSARFRLDRIEEIAGTVTKVRAAISQARAELEAVDRAKLPKRLRDEVVTGIARAADTDALLADAEAGLAILPRFLGADGPRTYLIAMLNSVEERGPGGSLLQFTRMTIDNGSPKLPKVKDFSQSVYNIDVNRQLFDIPLPDDAWYVREIPDARRFGNANWSPDWPLSAQVSLDYARAADPSFPEVDGVFAVDPVMMQNLMPGVGPFDTKYGNRISERRVVHFLVNKAYSAFGPSEEVRRAVLGDLVNRFYERMIRPAHPTELVQGFGTSLAEKHMQIWLADPAEQAFIERMDWDGGIDPAEDADYFNVVEQNVGGNKLDYFQDQRQVVDVTFEGDDAVSSALVELTNSTILPQHRYVMGDSGGHEHGLTRPMMNVYVPGRAELVHAEVDGTRVPLAQSAAATWVADLPPEHIELGKKVWSVALEIPIADTQSVRYDYRVPDVVRTVEGRRVYRLVVQHQPKVRPETVVIRIRLPEGAQGVRARGFQRRGNMLVLERLVRTDLELEVSWDE